MYRDILGEGSYEGTFTSVSGDGRYTTARTESGSYHVEVQWSPGSGSATVTVSVLYNWSNHTTGPGYDHTYGGVGSRDFIFSANPVLDENGGVIVDLGQARLISVLGDFGGSASALALSGKLVGGN